MLNAKARAALGDFLATFGQLLEIDVDGHVEWFYNVTRVIDRIPIEPAIHKDPRTARTRIYVNDAAKDLLHMQMALNGISGAEFAEPGPPPPRPRLTG